MKPRISHSSVILVAVFILALTVQGFASAQDASTLQYVAWQEPTTSAFSIEAPAGWQVQGELIDVLGTPMPSVFLLEPAEHAVIIAGTPQALVFAEPNPTLGLAEGAAFTFPDTNTPVTVKSAQTPVAFLQDYLTNTLLNGICTQVNVEDTFIYEPTDPTISTGELTLNCPLADGQAFGYFYTSLYFADNPTYGSVWLVGELYGYLAEPGYEQQADEALIHLAQSLTISQPQTETESSVDASVDAYQQAMNDAMTAEMISDMLWQQHQTNMAIIQNIGGGDYTWEWQYDYSYDYTP